MGRREVGVAVVCRPKCCNYMLAAADTWGHSPEQCAGMITQNNCPIEGGVSLTFRTLISALIEFSYHMPQTGRFTSTTRMYQGVAWSQWASPDPSLQ